MNATASQPALTVTPKPETAPRGLVGVRCPLCGEEDTLRLRLHDATYECSENECEVTAEELRSQIANYQGLLLLLEALPVLE